MEGINKLKAIGIVGCGRVSVRYKEVFSMEGISGGQVVSVCDLVPGRSEKLASELGARSFVNMEEMFEKENLDLVFILTESGNHYKHSKFCLDHDVNVIVEKPVTLRVKEAFDLIKLSEKKRLMFGVVFQNRYNPSVKYIRKLSEDNVFGKLILSTVRVRWCRYQDYYEDGWHGSWSMDGGVIAQQAIHHLDVLQWISGQVESVCSMQTKRLNNLEAEDTTVAILKFRDGSLGAIEATTAARPKDYEASFSIVGEKGLAEIGGIALNEIKKITLSDNEIDEKEIKNTYSQDVPNGYGLGHGPLIQDAVNRLNAGVLEPPVSASDGINTLKLVHALYKSEENKSWINLDDNPESSFLGIGSHD